MIIDKKYLDKTIFGAIIISLGFFIFYGLKEFFSAFLGALVFYVLFRKTMRFMVRKKKIAKPISAVFIILISFILVVLPLSLIASTFYLEMIAWLRNPSAINSSLEELSRGLNNYSIFTTAGDLSKDLQKFIAKLAPGILNYTIVLLGNLLMMYFFLYFLLINTGRLEAFIAHFSPFERHKIMPFGDELVMQTYGNAVGVPLVAIVQGVLAYIEYRICGVAHPGLWATLTGLASVIPIIGTAVIWLPVTFFTLVSGNIWQGFFLLAYSALIISTADNLVRIVVSKRVGNVHPVVTVLGVVLGLKFFGLPGLVFGPLLISYFLLFVKLHFFTFNIGHIIQKTHSGEKSP